MASLFLGLLVTVKNESMVLDEFLDHYRWQGVQKVYVIDNGSTDNTRQTLETYIQSGFVEYFYLPNPHSQVINYNVLYEQRVRNECTWLVVVDADEYMYNRSKGSTLASFLHTIPFDLTVAGVYLHWKMFGSCGYQTQPRGRIRASFVKRRQELDPVQQKAIVNTRFTSRLHIHSHFHESDEEGTVLKIAIDPSELALNHYPIMSVEYFTSVKIPRGDVFNPDDDKVRNFEYFERYDFNDVEDDELKRLVIDNENRSLGIYYKSVEYCKPARP